MTFVDTNVYMYAVGRAHPLRDAAREFFAQAARVRQPLCTSAEVLQELMHAYIPPGRLETLNAALTLADSPETEIWPLEREGRLPCNPAEATLPSTERERPLPSGLLPPPPRYGHQDLRPSLCWGGGDT